MPVRTQIPQPTAVERGGDDFYWKCQHRSWKSATDPGGRDSWILHESPDEAAHRDEVLGRRRKISVWNNSNMAMEYKAHFEGTRGPMTWYWVLEPGGHHHSANLSVAEGHRVQIMVVPWQITRGGCVDNGGRT
ncbi:hypothetical protein LT493_24475 [Streptomyces tricolor]|nr:hypothetical protein [Streptomyces tricolor]